MRFLFLLFFLILTNLLFLYSSGCSFQTIRSSEIEHKKNRKRKKKLFISMEGCGFVCDPFPSAQRAKFDPSDCKNPLPFTILQLGLEMNRRELDTVCHPRESLPIGICAQSSFLFYVLLYRATRSVRFHIHYDYLVACLLLPPSNSARRTGRIHTHTHTQTNASTD